LSIDLHSNGLQDQDWFRWSMATGGTVQVNLMDIQARRGDLCVRVFRLNSDGTLSELGNSTQTGGVARQTASVPVSAGDEIFVWGFGFNFARGTYILTVDLS